MRRTRLGLDSRVTRRLSAGMAAYVRELTRRLPRVAPEFEYVAFSEGGNFGWDEQVKLPLAMRRARLDLVHFLALYAPLAAPAPFVITIHDLIHLRFPQYFKATVRPYYQTLVRLACARAARIITDDERTVDDLVALLGANRSKIRVVPLGVDEMFFRPIAPYAAVRPYLLYAGNHRRHKDLATLFEAWSRLPPAYEADLYVTGADDFGGALQDCSTPSRTAVALGDVPASQLAALYAGARALVHPSLREGFGLPMLEAMAAGCPVVASCDAVPGVLEAAALTFPPRDVVALCARLETVLSDEGARERSVKLGRQVASRLTWDRCARATADIYAEVLTT